MQSVLFTGNAATGYTWIVPNGVSLILVSGCGCGGNGGDSTGATGGGGGSSGPFVYRLPLLVKELLPIAVRVGSASVGNYYQASWIAGPGLIDPMCQRDEVSRYFCFGFGGSGNANSQYGSIPSTVNRDAVNYGFYDNAHHPPIWSYLQADNAPFNWWEQPYIYGDGSNPAGDPYTYGLPGYLTVNGRGVGEALASDPTNRSGGPGGGNPWGRGGRSGQYGGTVNGGDGEGYGSAGGGAANGGIGGAGRDGAIRFEW